MGQVGVEFQTAPDWEDPIETAAVDIAPALPELTDGRYPLLRLIDPYGDTAFSSYQMEALIEELEHRLAETHDDRISHVLRLAERCRTRPHTWLVFVGD